MKMKKFLEQVVRIVLVLITAGVLYSCASLSKPAAPPDSIPGDPEILSGNLPNGIKYFIRRNHRPENRVLLRLVVNAGSVLEEENESGLAHFVEHMAFNGTENYEEQEIVNFMERIGMRFGPDVNAYTSFDETVYKLTLAADNPELIGTAFDILREWAFNITFDGKAVETEKTVILEEWRVGRGAGARMRDQYLPVLFSSSRYAERLPIGDMDVVLNATPEQLKSFYRKWYRPELMGIIVVGDIEPTEMEEYIIGKFTDIPDGVSANGSERKTYKVPDHEATLYSIATDQEAVRAGVELIHKHNPFHIETIEDYRTILAQNLFHRMFNRRLDDLRNQADPPFIHGYSGSNNIVRTKGLYSIGAVVPEDGISRGFHTLLTERQRVLEHGFHESELELAGRDLLRAYRAAWNERETTDSEVYAGDLIRHFLTGEAVPPIQYEYELASKLVPEISLGEVENAGRFLNRNTSRVVIITGPEKETLDYPSPEDLQELYREITSAKTDPYPEPRTGEMLLPDLPLPGTIISKEFNEAGEYHHWILSNGASIVVKQTDFKRDEILFSAQAVGGISRFSDDDLFTARIAPELVASAGLGDFNVPDLQRILAGRNGDISPYISGIRHGFTGSTSPEDMETLLQLIHLSFTSPRYDETAYSSYIHRLRGVTENKYSRPEAVFSDKIWSALYDGHPRSRPLNMETFSYLDPARGYDIYRELFDNAGEFTFIFVGNIDIQQMENFTETYIASLPGEAVEGYWVDRGVSLHGDPVVELELELGMEQRSLVQILFSGPHDWDPDLNHEFRSLTDFLEIRLREEIRERVGGTYGVGVGGSVHRIPRNEYLLSVGFFCDPERVEELTSLVFSEIAKAGNELPEDDYLIRVRETQRRGFEERLKQNSYWLGMLGEIYFHEIDAETALDELSRIGRLTPERIRDAAKRFLETGRYLKAVLYPKGE